MITLPEEKYSKDSPVDGFTLVEIVVASLLLAIISAAIFSVTLSSRRLLSSVNKRHFATVVAQTALENLRLYLDNVKWYNSSSPIYPTATWSCHNLNYLADNFLNMSSTFGTSEFATRYYGQWCYKIESMTDCPGGACNYRKATVVVNWTEL